MENAMIGKSLFTGEHVELTELDPEKDSLLFSTWTSHPVFARKMFHQPFKPRPVSELKKKLQEMLKEADESHHAIYFAVRKLDSPDLIGLLWFPWLDATHQTSTMHLSFGTEQDFDSYAGETLKLALYYAFMELSLHRVVVSIRADEPKWMELLEQSGFLREVLRRENVFSQGRYFDEYLYALMKSEWKQKLSEVTE